MLFNKFSILKPLLRKALTWSANRVAKTARQNASWSSDIPKAIIVGQVIEGETGMSISIEVDLSEKGAPQGRAFELGSGIHGEDGQKYIIEPKNPGGKLIFPISRWPKYQPPPNVDFAVFPGAISKKAYVMHPGVAARPYLLPSIEQHQDDILNRIAGITIDALKEDFGARIEIIK